MNLLVGGECGLPEARSGTHTNTHTHTRQSDFRGLREEARVYGFGEQAGKKGSARTHASKRASERDERERGEEREREREREGRHEPGQGDSREA